MSSTKLFGSRLNSLSTWMNDNFKTPVYNKIALERWFAAHRNECHWIRSKAMLCNNLWIFDHHHRLERYFVENIRKESTNIIPAIRRERVKTNDDRNDCDRYYYILAYFHDIQRVKAKRSKKWMNKRCNIPEVTEATRKPIEKLRWKPAQHVWQMLYCTYEMYLDFPLAALSSRFCTVPRFVAYIVH